MKSDYLKLLCCVAFLKLGMFSRRPSKFNLIIFHKDSHCAFVSFWQANKTQTSHFHYCPKPKSDNVGLSPSVRTELENHSKQLRPGSSPMVGGRKSLENIQEMGIPHFVDTSITLMLHSHSNISVTNSTGLISKFIVFLY